MCSLYPISNNRFVFDWFLHSSAWTIKDLCFDIFLCHDLSIATVSEFFFVHKSCDSSQFEIEFVHEVKTEPCDSSRLTYIHTEFSWHNCKDCSMYFCGSNVRFLIGIVLETKLHDTYFLQSFWKVCPLFVGYKIGPEFLADIVWTPIQSILPLIAKILSYR